MRRRCMVMIAGLVLVAAHRTSADLWQEFAAFRYCGDAQPKEHAAKKMERLVQDTPVSEYGALERKLVTVVSSETATEDAKAIACRFLQQVGSSDCIPAVAELLGDETLSHYARLVLERLPHEAADRALRGALESAPDSVKPGILGSLAARRDKSAVPAIAALSGSGDAAVAAAALRALGRIGGGEAARQLAALKTDAALEAVRMEAMVACAATTDARTATGLCAMVLAGAHGPSRTAALRIMAETDAARAAKHLTAAITGNDPASRRDALGIVAGTEGADVTQSMVGLLDRLPAARAAALITALGSRGDRTAAAALIQRIDSQDQAVRDAAVEALAQLGDATTVDMLLRAADLTERADRVGDVVARMTGEGVDRALMDALRDDKTRSIAIRALTARGAAAAVPALLDLTRTADPANRQEAWRGIGALASASSVDPIMQRLMGIEDASELGYAGGALRKICTRAEDRSACIDVAARYYDRADADLKALLVELAPLSGDAKALETVRKTLRNGPADQVHGAVNALAADPLLGQAKSAPDDSTRILALRGYIRIAGLPQAGLSVETRTDMLQTAAGLARRVEEKKQIISALREAATLEALDLLASFMQNEQLAAEAEMTAAHLIGNIRDADPGKIDAMAKRLQSSKNQTVVERATQVRRDLANHPGE